VYTASWRQSSAALALALAFLLPFRTAVAQGGGRIVGVVQDRDSGEPILGAAVLLRGAARTQLTDSAGRFVFLGVTPGPFELLVRRIGYQLHQVRGRVSIAVATELTIPLWRTQAVVLPEISVAARPFQRIDEPASVQTVERDQLRLAPVTTLSEVIELQAGVADGHFRGGRLGQATFVLDGLDVRDQFTLGALGTSLDLSPAAIEEVSVLTGGFGAQYGNAISGVVDVATRRGSATRWEARAAILGGQVLPDDIGLGFSRSEVSLGGPMNFLRSGATLFVDVAGTAAEDNEPRRYGLTCLRPEPGDTCPVERPIIPHHRGDQLSIFSRLDLPLSQTASVTLSATWVRDQTELYASRFKYHLANYLAERRTAAHITLSGQWQKGGGSRATLLTARVALTRLAGYLGVPEEGSRPAASGIPLARLRLRGEAFVSRPVREQFNQATGVPGYEAPGGTRGGLYGRWGQDLFVTSGTSGIAQRHQTDVLTLDLTATAQVSPQHLLLVGAQFKALHVQAYERAAAYLVAASPSAASFYPALASAYLSHTLKPVGNATLTLGARLEAFNPKIRFTTERRTFGAPIQSASWTVRVMPRVGFVMPLDAVGLDHTVARWNFGLSTQPPAFQFFFDSAIDDSLNTTLRRQGNPSLSFEGATLYELGVTHLFGPSVLFGVTAYYKELTGLVTSGVPVGRERRLFSNLDQGRVKGIEASLEVGGGRTGRRVRLAYTLQNAIGSVSTPYDTTGVRSGTRAVDVPLLFDRRHSIDLVAYWSSPGTRWSASVAGSAASGMPIPTRSDGRRLPWSVLVSGRLAKTLTIVGQEIETYAEGRNLLGWRVLRTARPETGDETVDLAALEARAARDVQGAPTVPRESSLYAPAFDANKDGLWTPEEQFVARRAALLDAADPSLFFGPPRSVRLGVAVSWPRR
jgi:hypothetical protein